MPTKKPIDVDEVRRLAAAGWTRPEIEQHVGVCRRILSLFLRANGIKTFGNRRNNFGRRAKKPVGEISAWKDVSKTSPSVRALGGNPFGL